jgi:arylformamidase
MTQQPIVWRGMTRAALDDAYNNSAAVPNSAEKVAEWTERSARFRETHPGQLDLAYGSRPRNRIDVFRCGQAGAPLFAYIHGGYWQRNSKDMYSCLAEGPLARCFDVAMIGYTLAPDVTLAEIVAETHDALRWLRKDGAAHGVGKGRLMVSGWSAGGHLTAMVSGHPACRGGVAISGIFDLAPIALNYLNEKLRLDPSEIAALSPLRVLPDRMAPLRMFVGRKELPELKRQSTSYADAARQRALPVELTTLPGHHHFSILDEISRPEGAITHALCELIGV